ncbi:MAG: AAA family ATPase [Candidatus Accumulibacter sp.]|nr:AAA family ATPase [Accumulibacter sp.]
MSGQTEEPPEDDAWPFDSIYAGEFVWKKPPPHRWLIEQRIERGRGVLFTGAGGSSKSRLLYHLAIGVAIGHLPWSWDVSHTGASILVMTEDTANDTWRAVWSACESMGLSDVERDLVASRLICYPLAGQTCRLLSLLPDGELVPNSFLAGLEDVIREDGDIAFVGLDPALGLTPGDELNQGHQRALGKMADDLAVRTGAAVALVAHATKASLHSDELGSHNSRGGGAITDAVRGEFSLRTMTAKEATAAGITDIEERKRHVQIVATKGNHLPPSAYAPVWLRRGEHGSLAEANLSFDGGAAVVTERDQRVLDVLKAMTVQHAARLGDWRAECLRQKCLAGTSHGAVEKDMQRSVLRLKAAGLIVHGTGKGVYLPAGSCDEA